MSLRYIAFYLPQFHPFPENDLWWGKGFTEWRNVARAKPLYDGHNQPRFPADLGYYDLRVQETVHAQIELAKAHGINAFCFHYYWFDGKRLMDRPVDAFLADKNANIEFCFCWANENWTRRWDAAEHEVLIAQHYTADWEIRFIKDMIPYFKDPRYLRVNGKPLLVVYRPQHIPDARAAGRRWREYCREAGIGEIHIVSALVHGNQDYEQYEFDAGVEFPPHNLKLNSVNKILPTYEKFNGFAVEYANVARSFLSRDYTEQRIYRTVFPDWDNTARVKDRALIVLGSTVSNYERWLRGATSLTIEERLGDDKLVFINAWNEWAEGCYLEPDLQNGMGYLEATLRVKSGNSLVNDIYDIAPERTRYKPAPALVAVPGQATLRVPFKFRVAHALQAQPWAFKSVRFTYRAGNRIAVPVRAVIRAIGRKTQDVKGLETTRPSAAEKAAFVERRLDEVSLDALQNVSNSKSAFLSSDRDTTWLAYSQARVEWKSQPELIFAEGTLNGPALAEMLPSYFDAHPMLFGKFFNCTAHPRAVALIDSGNRLISETVRIYKILASSWMKLDYLELTENGPVQTKPAKTFIDADVLIPMHGSGAFGHVIFDAIPQILAFEAEIKAGQIKILMNEKFPAWYPRILEAWGFYRHHFLAVPGENSSSYRFRSAIVSNALTTFSTFFPNPRTIESFRESLAPSSLAQSGGRHRLIYLSRSPGSTHSGRTILNEDELQQALILRGFHVVDPATLPYPEQIDLFHQADVIVGAHGSAFANLIWCRPGARVIDLMPDSWVNFWGSDPGVTEYWVARNCALKDLQYSAVLCKSEGSAKWVANGAKYSIQSEIDIDLLDRKIDSVLAKIGRSPNSRPQDALEGL